MTSTTLQPPAGTPDYAEVAKNVLRAELKRRGVSYADLVEKLAAIGVQENERNLNNKISRGSFSAEFFMQCLGAIGAKAIQIAD